MRKKILLLGSGELGKEFVIACQRLGQYIIAVDGYAGAPAMQVAHEFEVINMLDGAELDRIVAKHQFTTQGIPVTATPAFNSSKVVA
jgi:phosphoribosylglycinamide formyltransferase 2